MYQRQQKSLGRVKARKDDALFGIASDTEPSQGVVGGGQQGSEHGNNTIAQIKILPRQGIQAGGELDDAFVERYGNGQSLTGAKWPGKAKAGAIV